MSNTRYDLGSAQPILVGPAAAKLLYISSARYGGDWHSTLHTHTCTELFYVVGGEGRFKLEAQTLPVSAGDLVMISPNVEHTEVSYNASPLEYIVLGIEGMEFSADEEHRYSIITLGGEQDDFQFILRCMLKEIENKLPGYDQICRDFLDVLTLRLVRRANFPLALVPTNRRSSKECAAVRRYLDSHFKENITLDFLAELAHVSKYYLVHTFSREYHISPINYLIDRRIQESLPLLSESNHSLSQISHMLGFSSPSYFSQSFRKLQGISPMEYRKHQRTGDDTQN